MGNAKSNLENIGGKIFGGLKTGFNKVLDIGNTIRGGIQKGVSFVKGIPIIGNLADQALNMPIPKIGLSANQLGQFADMGLDTGGAVRNAYEGKGIAVPKSLGDYANGQFNGYVNKRIKLQ